MFVFLLLCPPQFRVPSTGAHDQVAGFMTGDDSHLWFPLPSWWIPPKSQEPTFHEDLEEFPDSCRIRYLPTRKTIDQTCSPVNRHLNRTWEPDGHQLGSGLDVWAGSGRLVLHISRTCLLSRSIVVTDSPLEAGGMPPHCPMPSFGHSPESGFPLSS